MPFYLQEAEEIITQKISTTKSAIEKKVENCRNRLPNQRKGKAEAKKWFLKVK